MNNSNRLGKIGENVEAFLMLVEESREKMSIKDHVIKLTMMYSPETDDCEIFIDQVDGRLSSISRVKNYGPGFRRTNLKRKIKKRHAKKLNESTKYFMDRIHKALRDRKIETIILEHNFKRGATDLFFAYPA